VWVIEYWNLRFVCNLVLGICNFRPKTPRQSHLSLTWPRGPGFLCLDKWLFDYDLNAKAPGRGAGPELQ
ncbi:MAG: hypothetical protein Q8P24_09230, partial [Desulfobacterales bacterium]|nr:hypothetical protein [Desulfobacterales bacterium]